MADSGATDMAAPPGPPIAMVAEQSARLQPGATQAAVEEPAPVGHYLTPSSI